LDFFGFDALNVNSKYYVKNKLISENCSTCCPCCSENNDINSFTQNLGNNSFNLLIEFFINFSLIIHEKSLTIPNDKEEDFNNKINFA